jgi:uroporphyrinogen-III synthase
VLPRGEDANPDLPQRLVERGAQVAPLLLYRKVPRPHDADLDHEIAAGRFAAFFASSPSAARWLFTGMADPALTRLRDTPAVVLGPFTRRYLEAHGVVSVRVAREASFPAAAELLETLAASSARA